MTRIYMIRHGETPYNVAEILTGRGSDPHLTERGISQAEAAGGHLYDYHNDYIEFIVSSNMTRTNQTAEVINRFLNKPIILESAIQEIDRGGFEGHSKHYALPILDQLADHESHPIHGGESINEFRERGIKVTCEYLVKPESVLFVTHGFFIEKIREYFAGTKGLVQNADIYILDSNEVDMPGKCGVKAQDVMGEDL